MLMTRLRMAAIAVVRLTDILFTISSTGNNLGAATKDRTAERARLPAAMSDLLRRSSVLPAAATAAPLDANSWRRGRSWSLGQVTGRWRLVGGVLSRQRCCTCVLSGTRLVAIPPAYVLGVRVPVPGSSLSWSLTLGWRVVTLCVQTRRSDALTGTLAEANQVDQHLSNLRDGAR